MKFHLKKKWIFETTLKNHFFYEILLKNALLMKFHEIINLFWNWIKKFLERNYIKKIMWCEIVWILFELKMDIALTSAIPSSITKFTISTFPLSTAIYNGALLIK